MDTDTDTDTDLGSPSSSESLPNYLTLWTDSDNRPLGNLARQPWQAHLGLVLRDGERVCQFIGHEGALCLQKADALRLEDVNVHLEARSGSLGRPGAGAGWVSQEAEGEGGAALSRAGVFLEASREQAVPVPAGA